MNKKLKRLFDELEEAIEPPRRIDRMKDIRIIVANLITEHEKPWWKKVVEWIIG